MVHLSSFRDQSRGPQARWVCFLSLFPRSLPLPTPLMVASNLSYTLRKITPSVRYKRAIHPHTSGPTNASLQRASSLSSRDVRILDRAAAIRSPSPSLLGVAPWFPCFLRRFFPRRALLVETKHLHTLWMSHQIPAPARKLAVLDGYPQFEVI